MNSGFFGYSATTMIMEYGCRMWTSPTTNQIAKVRTRSNGKLIVKVT